MKSLLSLLLIAALVVVAGVSPVFAQCGVNGTGQCGAPVVSSLNQQLAFQQAVNLPTGAASASASAGGGGISAFTAPQGIVASPQVQYFTAPQPQYVMVQPQALPQVQFGTSAAVAAVAQPQYMVAQPQYVVAQPQFVTQPQAAASTAASASTALPLVAPVPVLQNSTCNSGSCSRSVARSRAGGGVIAALLTPRGNVSRSVSRSTVRTN